MSTKDLYTEAPEQIGWHVPMAGTSKFTWEYDENRERLLALYQKGKDKQWDAVRRIDWGLDVDPYDALGLPDESMAIYGTPYWDKLGPENIRDLRRHSASWQFSQFLHGEQGAMICAARIVESVPDLDAKFYAATQTMDEARHAELYSRFLHDKIGLIYPINSQLQALLNDTLNDSRWDMPYLGMQVLIEGLALAAFGVLRDLTTKPLPRQILAYVMQDEARHVAFGRISLKDYYSALTEAERDEREEFVVDACYLMRDRFRGEEVFETLGMDVQECAAWVDTSPLMIQFRSHLFSRIVPIVKDIGLWGDKVQTAFKDMGVLEMAGFDIEAFMKADEDQADALDKAHAEMASRALEVDQVIAAGAN